MQEAIPFESKESNEPATSEPSIPTSAEVKEETPTSVTQPQTESMEVHKHPHHVMHSKKWPEYLLEFFMLFLAVFLGFVAENFREHIAEKERAEHYAKSLYEDLVQDTVRLTDAINNKLARGPKHKHKRAIICR